MVENDKLTMLNVSGIAIRAGISRNNIRYTEKELTKFAATLTQKPILKDHNAVVDNAVGLVTNSGTPDNGKNVQYKGWVKEDGTGLLEKIKDKRIKEVSIGAIAGRLVQEDDDSDVLVAEDLVGLELSLTPTPGIVGTSISQALENIRLGKKACVVESVNMFNDEVNEKMANKKAEQIDDEKKKKEEEQVKDEDEEDKEEEMVSDEDKKKMKKDEKADKKEEEKEHAVSQLIQKVGTIQNELDRYKKMERDNAVKEYKQLATALKLKETDMSKLDTETVKLLSEQLKGVNVDLTESIINRQVNNVPQINIQETTAYHNGNSLLIDEAYIIERPLDGGKGFAITCDPSKLKTEDANGKVNARWRLGKNVAPTAY